MASLKKTRWPHAILTALALLALVPLAAAQTDDSGSKKKPTKTADAPKTPEGFWASEKAVDLERSLDTFFRLTDSAEQKRYFESSLQKKGVGLSYDDLRAIIEETPPPKAAWSRQWKQKSPWKKNNPRAWFNVAIPEKYTPTKAYPLLVALHGSGKDGNNMVHAFHPVLTKEGWIVVFPTTLSQPRGWGAPEEITHVYRIIEWTARHFRIDFRRLVVSGASMGGYGTWSHVLARPELWSAAIPVAGSGTYHRGAENLLERMRGISTYILHGELDDRCPVEPAREASRQLKKLKIPHVYREVAGGGHSPPREEYSKLSKWIIRTPAKPWSPRPLFLPPEGKAPLWKEYKDPFELKTPDQAMDLIREGKYKKAREQIDKQLQMNSMNSRLYTMRAMTLLPGLMDPFPLSLRPSAFDKTRGWTAKNEALALTELTNALKSKSGSAQDKLRFATQVRLLRAQIYAKQFGMAADGTRREWLPKYSAFAREIAKPSEYRRSATASPGRPGTHAGRIPSPPHPNQNQNPKMTNPNNILPTARQVWTAAALCVAVAFVAVARTSAQTPKPTVPKGCWSVKQADRLEKAIDVFIAQGDAEKRNALYMHELRGLGVGASLENLEALRQAAPPAKQAENDPWKAYRVYKVPTPWVQDNPRGWLRLALPKHYTPTRTWPIVIALHGVSSVGDNLLGYYLPELTEAGYIVVFPTTLLKGQPWGTSAEMGNVYRVLDWTARRYRLDFRRMVITGASMGGDGTWEHLFQHPEVWSAAASGVGLRCRTAQHYSFEDP